MFNSWLTSPQMPEEEAFCVFVRLMQEYRLRELFKPSMAELGLCIYQFEYLLQVKKGSGGPWRLHCETCPQRGSKSFIYIWIAHHFLCSLCVTSGTTSRAECPFPVPEFPHIHVRLILVPYAFSHLPSSVSRHKNLWYFHVWGRKSFSRSFDSVYLVFINLLFQFTKHMY